jgi:hypothetical protein
MKSSLYKSKKRDRDGEEKEEVVYLSSRSKLVDDVDPSKKVKDEVTHNKKEVDEMEDEEEEEDNDDDEEERKRMKMYLVVHQS